MRNSKSETLNSPEKSKRISGTWSSEFFEFQRVNKPKYSKPKTQNKRVLNLEN